MSKKVIFDEMDREGFVISGKINSWEKRREEKARCGGLKMKENMKYMGGELEEKQIG